MHNFMNIPEIVASKHPQNNDCDLLLLCASASWFTNQNSSFKRVWREVIEYSVGHYYYYFIFLGGMSISEGIL